MECKESFTRKRSKYNSKYFDFLNFYNFVSSKSNKENLCFKSHFSRVTLWRKFKPFFAFKPESCKLNEIFPINFSYPWVFGIDGKWLKRKGVIIIGRNISSKLNFFWSWHSSESYESLLKDFEEITPMVKNFLPCGVVSDWKGSFVNTIKEYFHGIPHQRCLSHLLREAKRLLPLKSPFIATRLLREVAEKIFSINNPSDLYDWTCEINSWKEKYNFLLNEKTIGFRTKKKWWYTHGALRRAIKLLTSESDHSFAFLKFPFLPKTNNSLEGLNSQIKQKLGNHRGMKLDQQISFIFWLLTFSRIKNKEDLRKLWAGFKKEIFAG